MHIFVSVIFLLKTPECIEMLIRHCMIFFDRLCIDVRKYSDRGNVYITGDLNARTGEQLDYAPNIRLNCFVSTPDPDLLPCS